VSGVTGLFAVMAQSRLPGPGWPGLRLESLPRPGGQPRRWSSLTEPRADAAAHL